MIEIGALGLPYDREYEEKKFQLCLEISSLFHGAIQYGPTSWQYARLQTLYLMYCCPC
jgi:hypothetical protein